MHIEDLLKYKIKTEIINEINKLYNKDNLQYNKIIFNKFISKKIDSKLDKIKFLKPRDKFKYNDCHCKSRTWDNHYGTRCRYLSIKGYDYCKHHLNIINKNGKLKFGRYDDNKPIRNEKGNIIPWINKDKIIILDDIIQDNMLNITHLLRTKNRNITPRF
jgi:hypothetical protein